MTQLSHNLKQMTKSIKPKSTNSTIARNQRARFEYTLEDHFEAGLVLEGWEVKSLRAGKGGIAESYVIVKKGEAFLFGSQISPLLSASTHVSPDVSRTRKLLLNKKELDKLIGAVERDGYTIVPVALYWKHGRAKLDIAIAKGKKLHDKRHDTKDREWKRTQQRLFKKDGY